MRKQDFEQYMNRIIMALRRLERPWSVELLPVARFELEAMNQRLAEPGLSNDAADRLLIETVESLEGLAAAADVREWASREPYPKAAKGRS